MCSASSTKAVSTVGCFWLTACYARALAVAVLVTVAVGVAIVVVVVAAVVVVSCLGFCCWLPFLDFGMMIAFPLILDSSISQ